MSNIHTNLIKINVSIRLSPILRHSICLLSQSPVSLRLPTVVVYEPLGLAAVPRLFIIRAGLRIHSPFNDVRPNDTYHRLYDRQDFRSVSRCARAARSGILKISTTNLAHPIVLVPLSFMST